jgi:hypothetical protein
LRLYAKRRKAAGTRPGEAFSFLFNLPNPFNLTAALKFTHSLTEKIALVFKFPLPIIILSTTPYSLIGLSSSLHGLDTELSSFNKKIQEVLGRNNGLLSFARRRIS